MQWFSAEEIHPFKTRANLNTYRDALRRSLLRNLDERLYIREEVWLQAIVSEIHPLVKDHIEKITINLCAKRECSSVKFQYHCIGSIMSMNDREDEAMLDFCRTMNMKVLCSSGIVIPSFFYAATEAEAALLALTVPLYETK